MSFSTLARLAGFLLAFAVGLLVSAMEVRAGCAHSTLAQSADDPLAQLLDRFSAAPEVPPWSEPGRSLPCFGPSCSDAPPRSEASLIAGGHEVEPWAGPALPCAATGPGGSSCPPEFRRVRPIHEDGGVFHPPRRVRPGPFSIA